MTDWLLGLDHFQFSFIFLTTRKYRIPSTINQEMVCNESRAFSMIQVSNISKSALLNFALARRFSLNSVTRDKWKTPSKSHRDFRRSREAVNRDVLFITNTDFSKLLHAVFNLSPKSLFWSRCIPSHPRMHYRNDLKLRRIHFIAHHYERQTLKCFRNDFNPH